MPQKRKRYDKQFKIAAARVVLGGEMRAVDLARELGIKDSTLRRWAQEHGEMGDPRVSLVDRAFDVEARNRLWVDGIAYIGTGEGWLYLAAVIDAFHRKVVGWSMSGRMTEKPVADALEQAVGREGPPDDFSLGFHDDQGSQHASRAFQRCLESHGIAQSMSRKGNCLDNAKAENFFSMVKTELYYDWEGDDPDIFERDLEKYIDWYNNVRIKRRLDGSSPVEYRLSRAA